jgi:transcriptional regulator with XRE-family HTH domain
MMTDERREMIEGMEPTKFGAFLRQARERRQLSLADVANKTKVSPVALRQLETGTLDDLPAEVFVRGFIRAYAKAIGIPDAEPMGMFEQAVADRRHAGRIALASPGLGVVGDHPEAALGDEEGASPRRGIGLAVFVIIVLLIATITLSLFMRQPPQAGERLSQLGTTRDASGHVGSDGAATRC